MRLKDGLLDNHHQYEKVFKQKEKRMPVLHLKKRIWFSILGMFLGVLQTQASFTDIAPEDPNRPIFEHLQDIGVIHAFEDGSFRGFTPLTKAEGLALALRAGNIAIPPLAEGEGIQAFTDIDTQAWYAPFVKQGLKSRVIVSNSTLFRPEAPLTKAEFLAFLFRATQVDLRSFSSKLRDIAEDVPQEAWFSGHFAYAKKYQIAYLGAEKLYYPFKTLSRQEAALMTYRQLKVSNADAHTREFIELQAEIQQFLELIRLGKVDEAQFHLHQIVKLNDQLIRTKNSADLLATRSVSRSMNHLTDSLRFLQYGKKLSALENLMLASKQALKAGEQSSNIKPLANELSSLIREILLQVTGKKTLALRD